MYLLSRFLIFLLISGSVLACVDPYEPDFRASVNVLVVDGTITNLAEPQVIRLNRSKADPVSGRFGNFPITKAVVEVVVDSSRVVACIETVDGSYQLPGDFRGQAGHSYQLRFTLPDGTRYESDQQQMPDAVPIDHISVAFDPLSLPVNVLYPNKFRAGYNVFVQSRDTPNARNYYRWDWVLYEKQKWCRTCFQGIYVDTIQESRFQNGASVFTLRAVEDCVAPNVVPNTDFYNDYVCRTPCWAIIHNNNINVYDDKLSDGGQIAGRPVAQVPLLTRQPALVVIRQVSLTATAYRFYELLQQQTQNTGGLSDTPPSAPVGNVHNTANTKEAIVGFFTASAVTLDREWLDKKDATRLPLGAYDEAGQIIQFDDELFFAQMFRRPTPGAVGKPFAANLPDRVITAPCTLNDGRTPFKPEGWRD